MKGEINKSTIIPLSVSRKINKYSEKSQVIENSILSMRGTNFRLI
jgi:hypothetical protein